FPVYVWNMVIIYSMFSCSIKLYPLHRSQYVSFLITSPKELMRTINDGLNTYFYSFSFIPPHIQSPVHYISCSWHSSTAPRIFSPRLPSYRNSSSHGFLFPPACRL